VSRPGKYNKGSKRRIQQVRWTAREIISAALLLLAMAVLSVVLALWFASHDVDQRPEL
jgi:hypothetical protein